MKPHKWAKEIKAWADGAEIEYRWKDQHKKEWSEWEICYEPKFYYFNYEFRIKPQPKEPQYLYVYGWLENGNISIGVKLDYPYIGKIKLEID